ncbi:AAA family ATPase [Flavicella sediminum]|uniref:AAA family ATPase n=1 Tax=Flavicella sediminum TaxID=2585141 RepID=UPI00111FA88F|nr:ATP-binding protein [Flavicella sediminum]
MQQKIVITGGPSTGKTTLINSLEKQGFYCIAEASREITLEARKTGISQLFLTDPLLFSTLLLEKRILQYNTAHKTDKQIVLFDRGIPDIAAYLNFFKQKHDLDFSKINTENKYQKIFITPPWKVIHTTDNERFESFEEAVEIHKELVSTYTTLGYTPIEIPFGTPEERALFVAKQLSNS